MEKSKSYEGLSMRSSDDRLMNLLNRIIRGGVRILAVLIAIELFINLTLYLREDVIHVKLAVATALMAMARKVIVFDFAILVYEHVLATGAVVLASGITYWLIARTEGKETVEC